MLTLMFDGEWLKAAGFPIGAAAYLTADRRGGLAPNRIGLISAASSRLRDAALR